MYILAIWCFIFGSVVLEFELRASGVLGQHSTTLQPLAVVIESLFLLLSYKKFTQVNTLILKSNFLCAL